MTCVSVSSATQTLRPCAGAGKLQVREWSGSLREAAGGDDSLAAHMWIALFPIIWATLGDRKEQQVRGFFRFKSIRVEVDVPFGCQAVCVPNQRSCGATTMHASPAL